MHESISRFNSVCVGTFPQRISDDSICPSWEVRPGRVSDHRCHFMTAIEK